MPDNGTESVIQSTKRRKFIKYASIAGAAGVAGCVGDDDDEDDTPDPDDIDADREATLTILSAHSDPDTQEAFEAALDDWTEQVEADVDYDHQVVGFDEVDPELGRGMDVGDPPDIAFVAPTTAIFWGDRMADLSNIEMDVAERLQFTYDDKLVGIPFRMDVENGHKWIRRDIYEEAGIEVPDVGPPEEMAWTWEENLQNMEILDDHLEGEQMHPNLTITIEEWVMMINCDGDVLMRDSDYIEFAEGDEEPSVIMDEEPHRSHFIEAMDYRNELAQYSPDGVGLSWDDLITFMVTEQVATSYYSGRLLNNTMQEAPDVAEQLYPIPISLPPDWELYTGSQDSTVFSVPETENSDLAIDFINFFVTTDHYIDTLMSVPLHYLPPDPEVLFESDTFQEHEWAPEQDAYIEFIREYFDRATPHPFRTEQLLPEWTQITREHAPRMWAGAIAGQMSPENALDETAQDMRTTMDQLLD